LPLEPDDDWPTPPLTVLRTPDDPTTPPQSDRPPTHINIMTHWWDGSQVYANNLAEQECLRSHEGGTLRLENNQQPIPSDPARNPAPIPGFWLGRHLPSWRT